MAYLFNYGPMRILIWSAIGLCSLLVTACEEEFTPAPVEGAEGYVVEGYIEAGDNPTPPYVILSRSFPFFNEFSPDDLEDAFVHDAIIKVDDGEKTVTLTEICLDELPPEFREQVGTFLGTPVDSIGFNFCAYIDLSFSMLGEAGKTYELTIDVGEDQLRAITTIPEVIPLDTLWFSNPPGEPSEVYAQLNVILNDPAGEPNFYRYLTQEGDHPLLSPFTSVTDDLLFDGQAFEFPLPKAEPLDTDFDPESFGYYIRGSAVRIKWMTIDEAHFNFWNTLEFSTANQGPFSSYTRIDHNIEGGIGIWGGIAARYYDLEVPNP